MYLKTMKIFKIGDLAAMEGPPPPEAGGMFIEHPCTFMINFILRGEVVSREKSTYVPHTNLTGLHSEKHF